MTDRKRVADFPRARLMDDRRSLPIALLRAREAVMSCFRPHHRKGGVTEPQWRVIRVLYLDGEMDAAELARRSYLLAPSLSRILKDLEATGYLRRRPGDADSRQSLLSLSPKGSAMVTGAAPFLDRIHREIARRVGRDRIDELLALLAELERALQRDDFCFGRRPGSRSEAAHVPGRRRNSSESHRAFADPPVERKRGNRRSL